MQIQKLKDIKEGRKSRRAVEKYTAKQFEKWKNKANREDSHWDMSMKKMEKERKPSRTQENERKNKRMKYEGSEVAKAESLKQKIE